MYNLPLSMFSLVKANLHQYDCTLYSGLHNIIVIMHTSNDTQPVQHGTCSCDVTPTQYKQLQQVRRVEGIMQITVLK